MLSNGSGDSWRDTRSRAPEGMLQCKYDLNGQRLRASHEGGREGRHDRAARASVLLAPSGRTRQQQPGDKLLTCNVNKDQNSLTGHGPLGHVRFLLWMQGLGAT